MRITRYTLPSAPGLQLYRVDLARGESHTWRRFTSRNAGHVVISGTVASGVKWDEFDPNAQEFLDWMKLLDQKGWVYEDVDEVPANFPED